MKPVQHLIAIGLLALLAGVRPLAAQGFLHASGREIVDGAGNPVLLRGMGLGGWMLQEGYMMGTASVANTQHQLIERLTALIGSANTNAFYEAWRANHVTKRDIDSLAAWGFNSVRLPMHYNLFTLPIQAEPVFGQQTWLNTGFVLVDSLLSWCEQNQIYLILDLHAAPGGQGMDAAISDYDSDLPSLWESAANQAKTVALWARIADRYKNEPWIGGYDLINEVNWNLPGNTALRNLYGQITQAIRQVDQNHLIIIEGNWFANDFTGLTPPWDNNMAYSFHRYWAYNTQETIQGYLNMRQTYNVPLWMGEAGENSNVWFRDCIRLLESNNIGWAWWPMKKTDNISSPYSITRNQGYQDIIRYWSGQGPQPDAGLAHLAMMQLATDANIANCRFHPDVLDAMFRQVAADTAKPFRTQAIPGTVLSAYYDFGPNGVAYYDSDDANYQVSTGSFRPWNSGYSYRNDGVDLERTQDAQNSSGHCVGWTSDNEWLQYEVQIATPGAYQVQVRAGAPAPGGECHLELDGADVSPRIQIGATGGYQSWQNFGQSGVILDSGRHKLRIFINESGFNLSSVSFAFSGPSSSVPAVFLSARTLEYQLIEVNLNKPMQSVTAAQDFKVFVNNAEIALSSVATDSLNPRLLRIRTAVQLRAGQQIRVSYTGASALAQDGTALQGFAQQPVANTLLALQAIPGKIEAEAYIFQQGIQLEFTTDAGAGQNIGYCDPGDYWDYNVEVAQAGNYQAIFRVASTATSGTFAIQLLDKATGTYQTLNNVLVPNTGGWQTWTNVARSVQLPAGVQRLRLLVTGPLFNLNWIEFTFLTRIRDLDEDQTLQLYPNPSGGLLQLELPGVQGQSVGLEVLDAAGRQVWGHEARMSAAAEPLDLRHLPGGWYLLRVRMPDGGIRVRSFVLRM